MTDFVIYDVFTDRAFGGNPLAVIPDAPGLDEADLQRVAREFNFSERSKVPRKALISRRESRWADPAGSPPM